MTLAAWRITKRKNTASAFTGAGARLYGGRWNSPGAPVVYAADSQSLAVLELLVHLDSSDVLRHYVLYEVRFHESLVSAVRLSELPKNWRANPPPAKLKTFGDNWVARAASVVLRVPSAIVPEESNFLLNPRHRDFKNLASLSHSVSIRA